jgi:DNA mismatch endonuclease (patch repair protein)
MADVFTRKKRSEVMGKIRGRGNKDTEEALIAVFRKYHISGWRRHQNLMGKPDFTFPRERLVVFVDGCFWHRCPIHATYPKNNSEFWENKLEGNKRRDRFVSRRLRASGWHVMRIWEHEFKRPDLVAAKIQRNLDKIKLTSSQI